MPIGRCSIRMPAFPGRDGKCRAYLTKLYATGVVSLFRKYMVRILHIALAKHDWIDCDH